MSKPLDERLRVAKEDLRKIDEVIQHSQHSTRVVQQVLDQIKQVTTFGADIDHWLRLIETRAASRRLLTGLENQADTNDMVELGKVFGSVGYQHLRFIGVQAYLTTTWAIADRIATMAGHILCIKSQLNDPKRPPQLLSHFVGEDTKSKTAAMAFYSLKPTFGWPIGISYALRNHFCHDGGEVDGTDFFDGPGATSGFRISAVGWDRVEKRAKSYGVDVTQHRAGPGWPTSPCDDLRAVLDFCERETDDALGILVGSACRALFSHVGFIVGEL